MAKVLINYLPEGKKEELQRIGEALARIRERIAFSQIEVAREMDRLEQAYFPAGEKGRRRTVSNSSVSQHERQGPSTFASFAIHCEALGVTMGQVLSVAGLVKPRTVQTPPPPQPEPEPVEPKLEVVGNGAGPLQILADGEPRWMVDPTAKRVYEIRLID